MGLTVDEAIGSVSSGFEFPPRHQTTLSNEERVGLHESRPLDLT